MTVEPAAATHSTVSFDLTGLGAPPSHPPTPRPLSSAAKDRLIAPLILPPRPPTLTNLSDLATDGLVSLTNCYAGLFARLPSLWQMYEAPHSSAQALYNYLFAPTEPLDEPLPKKQPVQHSPSPTSPADPSDRDASMGTGEPAPEPASVTPHSTAPSPAPTPFAALLDSFVDIPASFQDPHDRRTPTVLSYSLPDRVQGTAIPPVKLTPLLHFLDKHLTPHLRSQIGTRTQSCFVTLVIGHSTDPRVGPTLHSHLVCAAVAPSSEDYSVLFIPSDLLTDFSCPLEWQPLLLYIAAALSYPDLPFIVTTPDYIAGALCTAQGLRNIFQTTCPHIFLATADALASPHVFLHLPPPVLLSLDAMDTTTDNPSQNAFRFRSPEDVTTLIQLTASDQFSSSAANRTALTDAALQDVHFPLYCTPYYGYSPTNPVEFQVELLQLTNHLLSTLSLLSQHLDDNPHPTPSALLPGRASFSVPLRTLTTRTSLNLVGLIVSEALILRRIQSSLPYKNNPLRHTPLRHQCTCSSDPYPWDLPHVCISIPAYCLPPSYTPPTPPSLFAVSPPGAGELFNTTSTFAPALRKLLLTTSNQNSTSYPWTSQPLYSATRTGPPPISFPGAAPS